MLWLGSFWTPSAETGIFTKCPWRQHHADCEPIRSSEAFSVWSEWTCERLAAAACVPHTGRTVLSTVLQYSEEDHCRELHSRSKIIFHGFSNVSFSWRTKLVSRLAVTRSLWQRFPKHPAASQALWRSDLLFCFESCRSVVGPIIMFVWAVCFQAVKKISVKVLR